MVLVPLTAGASGWHYAAMVTVFVVWGTAGFGMMAPQQSRLATMAPAHAPLLLSLNTSMLYAGTALGAAVGGATLPLAGFARLAWVGLPFALVGLWSLRGAQARDARTARASP
jgi:DHA1 family inner membrane transport protein